MSEPAAKIYTGAPRISTEYRDCSMPMAFDQHKGCGYRCLYCFAYYQRVNDAMSRNDYAKNIILKVNTERVLKMIRGEATSGNEKFFYEQFIKRGKVIQWGALGDPFCPYEKMWGTGLPILKAMQKAKVPVSFSTKSEWMTRDDRYMNIFKENPEYWHFKFSIITMDLKKSFIMERGAPSPQERFAAMKRLSDIGCATTLRFRPYIIGLGDKDTEALIKSAKEAGAISVSTEFFCLETRAGFTLKERYKEMSKLVGFDIYKFYRKHSTGSGYLRLNRAVKEPYVKGLKELCDKYGMKLYVSDCDFKEISCHGSCCGLPQRPPFENYNKAQLTELICWMRDNGKRTITWREYLERGGEDFEWQHDIEACVVHNFGDKKGHHRNKDKSIYDHNRNSWNDPNNHASPYRYFSGLFKPIGKDEENNIIYELQESMLP